MHRASLATASSRSASARSLAALASAAILLAAYSRTRRVDLSSGSPRLSPRGGFSRERRTIGGDRRRIRGRRGGGAAVSSPAAAAESSKGRTGWLGRRGGRSPAAARRPPSATPERLERHLRDGDADSAATATGGAANVTGGGGGGSGGGATGRGFCDRRRHGWSRSGDRGGILGARAEVSGVIGQPRPLRSLRSSLSSPLKRARDRAPGEMESSYVHSEDAWARTQPDPRASPWSHLPSRTPRLRSPRAICQISRLPPPLLLPERLQLLPPGGPEVVLLRRHVDGRRRASSPALPYRSRLVLAFGTRRILKEQKDHSQV